MSLSDGVQVKKTLLGVYKQDSEGDYILLTKEQHGSNKAMFFSLRSQYTQLEHESENKYNNLKKQAVEKIKDKEKEISMLQSTISNLQSHVKNLKRICIERANADRDIRPKKKRSGYILIKQQERKIVKNRREKVIWVARYQTPYLNDMAVNTMKNLVLDEINDELKKDILFSQGNKYWEFQIRADKAFKNHY